MYYLNKIVGWLISPMGVALFGFALTLFCRLLGMRKCRRCLFALSLAWLWIWATPLMSRIVGASLEREFLVGGKVPRVEDFPEADAIELHGGSMGFSEKLETRGEMWTSADRVWMAARLWKEQVGKRVGDMSGSGTKDLKIYCTGGGAEASTKQLLLDFGVPEDAIVFNDEPRNTEEEAKLIKEVLVGDMSGSGTNVDEGLNSAVPLELPTPTKKPRVLVVTSAWHMKRTLQMYAKYAPNVEAIPVACDFENSIAASNGWNLSELLPSPASLMWNSVTFHEWLGLIGYTLFRR